jgi:hypothetical protein
MFEAYVSNISDLCCKYFMNITKVDLDVAHIAMAIYVCFKCFMYVASVLFGCFKNRSKRSTCCNSVVLLLRGSPCRHR